MGDMNHAARQRLSTGLGQRLSLAPGLAESLRLLSLSGVELTREVDAALEENIMLEREEPPTDLESPPGADAFDARMASAAQAIEETQSAEEDLRTHLALQLPLENFSPRDRVIAETIIDALDEDGYLHVPEAALLDAVSELDPAPDADELDMVIRRGQCRGPTGVAARDHAECLLLQLHELADTTPARDEAETLLRDHFHELGRGQLKPLARSAGLKPDDVRSALALIQTLDPHPGYRYSAARIEYLVPELLARREETGWKVAFNPAVNPGLRVNAAYTRCIAHRSDGDAKALAEQAQAARTLVAQLADRRETLLKVGTALVRHQSAVLESGPTRLAPLTMQTIASERELHESTVARAVQGKSIATPRGTIALRHCVATTVSKLKGGGVSTRA